MGFPDDGLSDRTLGIGQGELFDVLRHKSPAPGVQLVVKAMVVEGLDKRRVAHGHREPQETGVTTFVGDHPVAVAIDDRAFFVDPEGRPVGDVAEHQFRLLPSVGILRDPDLVPLPARLQHVRSSFEHRAVPFQIGLGTRISHEVDVAPLTICRLVRVEDLSWL